MKIDAVKIEPTKPGWYVVEYSEFPSAPALMYYDQRGWQRRPGTESFFGAREGDVWWDQEGSEDYTRFMLRVLI